MRRCQSRLAARWSGWLTSCPTPDARACEGRPPLRDTLTGGRPPGRKIPDPLGGRPMIGRNEKRRHRPSDEIATTPENPGEAYCADGHSCRLASCMGAKDSNLEHYALRDTQAPLDVLEVSGSIKWFDPSKGYGFIVPDRDLPDILVHVTCLRGADLQTAYEGTRVVCEAIQTPKGLHAVRILAVDEFDSDPPLPIATADTCRSHRGEQLGRSSRKVVQSRARIWFSHPWS